MLQDAFAACMDGGRREYGWPSSMCYVYVQ